MRINKKICQSAVDKGIWTPVFCELCSDWRNKANCENRDEVMSEAMPVGFVDKNLHPAHPDNR